jgi:hypothetical protein
MSSVGVADKAARRVLEGRKCKAFAGVGVMLLLVSGSVMGLALMASGQTFSDLVFENAANWKIKDVSLYPNPMNPNIDYPVYYWDYRTPEKVSGALQFQFNDVEDEWFTVYLENVWEGELSGEMKITALFEIKSTSYPAPMFEARRADQWTQVCLNFQTTGGAYDPYDLWWSTEYVVLTSYDSSATSVALNTPITLEVTLDPANWFNYYGHLGTASEEDLAGFNTAIADIHEIGFSFGRTGSITSGVALTQGEASFVLKQFEMAPIVTP